MSQVFQSHGMRKAASLQQPLKRLLKFCQCWYCLSRWRDVNLTLFMTASVALVKGYLNYSVDSMMLIVMRVPNFNVYRTAQSFFPRCEWAIFSHSPFEMLFPCLKSLFHYLYRFSASYLHLNNTCWRML